MGPEHLAVTAGSIPCGWGSVERQYSQMSITTSPTDLGVDVRSN